MAEFQVKTGGGDGLVARYGDGILFVPVADARSNDLVSVFRLADSDEVFDLVAAYVVDVDFEAPSFALIVVTDEKVQMRVFGDLEMITDFPSVPMISGRGSRTWVDHTAPLTGGSFLHTGVAPDPRTDLVTGVVIGGGVQLVIGGEASDAAPVATIAFDDPPAEEEFVADDAAEEAGTEPEVESVLEPEPIFEVEPPAETEPVGETEPAAETDPATQTVPATETDPVEETEPAEEAELMLEPEPVLEAEPTSLPQPPVSPFSAGPDDSPRTEMNLPPAPTAAAFAAAEPPAADPAAFVVPQPPAAPFTPVDELETSMFVVEPGSVPLESPELEDASGTAVDDIMAQIGTENWVGGSDEIVEPQALMAEPPASTDHLPGWASAGMAPSAESQMPSTVGPVSQVGTVDPPAPPPVGFGPDSGLPDRPPMPPAPDSFDPLAEWSDRRINADETLSPLPPAPGVGGERRTAYVLRLDDGTTVPVDSPLVFGRRPSTEGDQRAVKLRGDHVSRSHLLVQMTGGELTITDTGSRNGSAVIPLVTNTPQPLDEEAYVASTGDRVFFGSRSFVVERSGD